MADPLSIVASTATIAKLASIILTAVKDLEEDQKDAEKIARKTRRVVKQLTAVASLIETKVNEVCSDERTEEAERIQWYISAKEGVKTFEENLSTLNKLVRDPKSGIRHHGWRKDLEKEVKETLENVDRQIGILGLMMQIKPTEKSAEPLSPNTERTITNEDDPDIVYLSSLGGRSRAEHIDNLALDFIKRTGERKDSSDEILPRMKTTSQDSSTTEELFKALDESTPDKLSKLLDNNADVTAYQKKGGYATIHQCAHLGRVDMLEVIISKRSDQIDKILNFEAEFHGLCPLHIAAESDRRLDFAKLAQKHGAQLDKCDADSRTPYDIARKEKSWDFMDWAKEINPPKDGS